jgi:hypothetical protein
MINKDKNQYCICNVHKSSKDVHFKHFSVTHPLFPKATDVERALIEAQRLADKFGKKVVILRSIYNVYPSSTEKKEDTLKIRFKVLFKRIKEAIVDF